MTFAYKPIGYTVESEMLNNDTGEPEVCHNDFDSMGDARDFFVFIVNDVNCIRAEIISGSV